MRKIVIKTLKKLNLDRSTVSTIALLSGVSSFFLNILCAAFLYIKEVLFGNLFPIFLLTVFVVSFIIFYFATSENRGVEEDGDWDDKDLDYES